MAGIVDGLKDGDQVGSITFNATFSYNLSYSFSFVYNSTTYIDNFNESYTVSGPETQVTVTDGDNGDGGLCKSINDPHITTFDGRLVASNVTSYII